jgi:hypothetical protein
MRELLGREQEVLLAHEFTHSLQEQHDLPDASRRLTTDGYRARQIVVEGDASLTAQQYWQQYDIRGSGPVAGRENQSLTRGRWGLSLSTQVRLAGVRYFQRTNTSAQFRNDALRNPPETTAEILHPDVDAELPGEPVPVPTHESLADATPNRLGELLLRLPLRVNGLSEDSAAEAASGWRNDTLLVTTTDDGVVGYWGLRFADSESAATYVEGWELALDNRNATSEEGQLVVPATEHYPEMRYVIRQNGPVVQLVAGESPETVTAVADSLPDRDGT